MFSIFLQIHIIIVFPDFLVNKIYTLKSRVTHKLALLNSTQPIKDKERLDKASLANLTLTCPICACAS